MLGSPTKNGPVVQQTSLPSTNLDDKDIPGLVNALAGITINNARGS